jgi:hypothetical protein
MTWADDHARNRCVFAQVRHVARLISEPQWQVTAWQARIECLLRVAEGLCVGA